MAYSDVAALTNDMDFTQRTRAAVAMEGVADPVPWVAEHQWQMAATPGFGDKYAAGIINGVPRPGNDPSVISDGDILSAVQAIGIDAPAAAEAEAPTPAEDA